VTSTTGLTALTAWIFLTDEAAQAVEPSTLIPLKYNPQTTILVGDPCQLPATVFSRVSKSKNYEQSLFQVVK
jgi:senataxin